MPIYDYRCIECGVVEGEDWPMGTAPTHKLHAHGEGEDFHYSRMDRVYSFVTTKMPTGSGKKFGRGK